MAAPLVKFYACLDGGETLRQKLIDSGPVAIWPFSDLYGGADGGDVEEIIRDAVGVEDNVGRGDPGLLPEYGCAFGFTAAGLRYVTVDHVAAFSGTTSVAFGMMFLLGEAGILQNVAVKDDVWEMVITSGNVLQWTVKIAGTARTVSYTITDTADWMANPRFLVGRYTGSNLQIYQITSAGVVTQLATAAWSGAVNTNTNDLYIGRRSSAIDYLSARLQLVTYWVDDYPTDGELADFALSIKWTEITTDVRANFTATWGIPETSPAARCGVPGILQFTLRNGLTNSARTRSYYTIGHASCRTGFALGIMVRCDLIDPAAPTAPAQRLIGRLIAAPPSTGRFMPVVECTVTDYFDELQRAQLPPLPIVQNETYSHVVSKIITGLAVRPHALTATYEGSVFPYGLDQAQDEESSTLDELERLAVSEWGFLSMRAGGEFRRDTRIDRQVKTTPDWTLDESDIYDLEIERTTREEIITKTQVAVYPRTESAGSSVTIFTLGAPLKFEVGETHIIQAPYTDPDNPDARIGLIDGTGASVLTVNTAEDGSGTVTALVGTVTYGANSAKAFLTNPWPYPVWLRGLTLTGKTVSTYKAHNANAEAAESLRARVGDNLFRVEQPYSDDPTAAAKLAQYLLSGLQVERPSAKTVILRATAASSANVIDCVVNVQCGDLIALSHDQAAIDGHYFVNGVTLRGSKGQHGTEIRAELTVSRRLRTAWVFGVAGFSNFGTSTYMGF